MKTIRSLILFSFVFVLGVYSCKTPSNPSLGSSSSSGKKLPANGKIEITEISTDPSYGYTQGNPINVGGARDSQGPVNERKYLDLLAGPKGETISYERLGSCCQFETPNGMMGGGLLDKYEITWKGQGKKVILFINMYDYSELKAPVGFTIR